ncbi:16176_t:CDS:2, partial [Gigaspora rosea]
QVTREGALENSQTTVKERVDNSYIDSSQELAIQETVVVDQNINMERKTTLSELEEAQSNLYNKKAVISGNVEPSDTLTKSLKEKNIAPVTPVVNREETTNLVRNPELPAVKNQLEILQYIRDQFEVLYQDEPAEINAIEALTSDLPSVSSQQNEALIKKLAYKKSWTQ